MKLLEALKVKKGKFEIPDCSRDDLPELFKELGFKVGAEIGVYRGTFTKKFLDAGLEMYGIDPWTTYEDYDGDQLRKIQEREYKIAMETLANHPKVHIIRKTSMEAVKDFENDSLDFVYIDGHHAFKYIAEDLWEWSKKVKKGGIIAGHDYVIPVTKRHQDDRNNLHVKYVVDAFVQAFEIKDWYILGSKEKLEGQKRDAWRSFMWVKDYK